MLKYPYQFKRPVPVYDQAYWTNHLLPLINQQIDEKLSSFTTEINRINELSKKYYDSLKHKHFHKVTFTLAEGRELMQLKALVIGQLALKTFAKDFITNELQYEEGGLISQEIMLQNKELSQFNVQDKDNQRWLINSTWGVFNNNVIFNFQTVSTFSLSAFSLKPAQPLFTERATVLFTNCYRDLSFSFTKYHKSGNKNSSSIFENKEFAAKYEWNYNNAIGMLVYFTPWAQETFLKVNQGQEPRNQYQFFKNGSIIRTPLTNDVRNSLCIHDEISNFIKSIESFDDGFKVIRKSVINYIYARYTSIAFVTLIPVINTENQTDLINHMIKSSDHWDKLLNMNNVLTHIMIEYLGITHSNPSSIWGSNIPLSPTFVPLVWGGPCAFIGDDIIPATTNQGNEYCFVNVFDLRNVNFNDGKYCYHHSPMWMELKNNSLVLMKKTVNNIFASINSPKEDLVKALYTGTLIYFHTTPNIEYYRENNIVYSNLSHNQNVRLEKLFQQFDDCIIDGKVAIFNGLACLYINKPIAPSFIDIFNDIIKS